MRNGSDLVTAASTAVENQRSGYLRTLIAGRKELLFLPSSEAAPPGNIKYEFVMKNEDYHNRCPSCYLLVTKRIGLPPDTLKVILAGNRCHCAY